MGQQMNQAANGMVEIIRELIRQELSSLDHTYFAYVKQVNENGSVNVSLVEDPNHIITNIQNNSKYELQVGDEVVVYAINNRLGNNSFVIARSRAYGGN